MYIPIWLIIYTIIFGAGVWYGKYVCNDLDLSNSEKWLGLACIILSVFFVAVLIVFLLGYSPTILTFC